MPGPADRAARGLVNHPNRVSMAADRSPGGGVRALFVCAPLHSGNSALRQTCTPILAHPAHRPRFATCVLAVTGETRRSLLFSDLKESRKRPQPALWVERLANASPLQTDDIRAHRQQNGDAYSDNDQEEFTHCSASRRSQGNAAGIVLCWQANTPAFAKGPPLRRAFGSRGGTAIRSRRRNSR